MTYDERAADRVHDALALCVETLPADSHERLLAIGSHVGKRLALRARHDDCIDLLGIIWSACMQEMERRVDPRFAQREGP